MAKQRKAEVSEQGQMRPVPLVTIVAGRKFSQPASCPKVTVAAAGWSVGRKSQVAVAVGRRGARRGLAHRNKGLKSWTGRGTRLHTDTDKTSNKEGSSSGNLEEDPQDTCTGHIEVSCPVLSGVGTIEWNGEWRMTELEGEGEYVCPGSQEGEGNGNQGRKGTLG